MATCKSKKKKKKEKKRKKEESWRMLENLKDWGATEEEEENTYRERGLRRVYLV
jgi:hypothetical protein